LDLVQRGSAGALWFENLDGQGTFGSVRILYEGSELLAIGDVDRDGDEDLVVGKQYVAWIESVDGAFQPPHRIAIGVNADVHQAVLLDVDADGDLDLLTSTHDQGVFTDRLMLRWYENLDGSGAFELRPTLLDQEDARALDLSKLIADDENDGDWDFLIASLSGSLGVHQNLGSGQSETVPVAIGIDTGDHDRFADFDADGHVDVLRQTDGDDELLWYRNLGGSQGFAGQVQLTPFFDGSLLSAAMMDMDLDGLADVVYGRSNRIAWRRNQSFAEGELLGPEVRLATTQVINADPLLADVNGDGVLDLIARGFSLSWFPGRAVDPFNSGDFNGDQVVDQEDLDLVLLYWAQDGAAVLPAWRGDPPQERNDQDELDRVLLHWGANSSASSAAPTPQRLREAKQHATADDSATETSLSQQKSRARSKDRFWSEIG
jgi:hypothetical protein